MNIPFKSKTEMIGYYILLGVVVVVTGLGLGLFFFLDAFSRVNTYRLHNSKEMLWIFLFCVGSGITSAVGLILRQYRARGRLDEIKARSAPPKTEEELAREILAEAEGETGARRYEDRG